MKIIGDKPGLDHHDENDQSAFEDVTDSTEKTAGAPACHCCSRDPAGVTP
ncbi:MAG: hypothetical protein KGL90_08770 [Burkholderiales bacterium]|nr:hypothetical protein [Burkholderiales bacterium]